MRGEYAGLQALVCPDNPAAVLLGVMHTA